MKHEQPGSWLHPLECECDRCEPIRPATSNRLTATHISLWCGAGIVVGNAVAFIIDPHAALAALAAPFGVML
ncbi:hypothetical protein [Sphingomonas sp. CFBP 8760]|uniref:hypothetical protein n=1 Tax=Sphingomonas sp. CFBP 8760 TaxID=2775282 RepID=UPI001786FBC1|nr:hypothetical protein [Sphingomonas sp. CFBP 8760]MBD8548033.1 hypothetical protein [Sphingomonas sp. CFBP 8760]